MRSCHQRHHLLPEAPKSRTDSIRQQPYPHDKGDVKSAGKKSTDPRLKASVKSTNQTTGSQIKRHGLVLLKVAVIRPKSLPKRWVFWKPVASGQRVELGHPQARVNKTRGLRIISSLRTLLSEYGLVFPLAYLLVDLHMYLISYQMSKRAQRKNSPGFPSIRAARITIYPVTVDFGDFEHDI